MPAKNTENSNGKKYRALDYIKPFLKWGSITAIGLTAILKTPESTEKILKYREEYLSKQHEQKLENLKDSTFQNYLHQRDGSAQFFLKNGGKLRHLDNFLKATYDDALK